MEKKEVKIQSITVKDEVQQRANLNYDCIKEYADEIANDNQFPPLEVYFDGESMFLADGFHRYEAYKLAGVETIEVIVREGGLRDAILHAVGANADHGLRRTNADKRKAVTTLLLDEEWKHWSDGVIANKCRVSQPFVSRLRNELTQNGFESSTNRIGKDGRSTDVSNIGTKAAPPDPGESQASVSDNNEQMQEEDVTESHEDGTSAQDVESSGDSSVSLAESEAAEGQEPLMGAGPEIGKATSDGTDSGESPENKISDDPGVGEGSEIEESIIETGDEASNDETGSEEDAPEDEATDPRELRIKELITIIQEKNERIKELEAENEYLKDQLKSYEKHPISHPISTDERSSMMDFAS
jgi:uncharacterized ParB-like nuclease family protein